MTTSARAGGLVREVIRGNTKAAAHAGGLAREVIRASNGIVRVDQVVREILVQDVVDQANVDQVVREALITTGSQSVATRAYVDQLVREALVFGVGPAQPVPPNQGKKHKHNQDAEAEADRIYDQAIEDWEFWTRRRTAPPILSRPRQRPWERHHFLDDDEADWQPPRRGGTPIIVPSPQAKPWLREHFPTDDDDDAWAFFLRHPASPATPVVVTVLSYRQTLPLQQPDESDEDWSFFIRRSTAPFIPTARRLLPQEDQDDNDDWAFSTRRWGVPSTPQQPGPSPWRRAQVWPEDDYDYDPIDTFFIHRFGLVPGAVPPTTPPVREVLFHANMGRFMNRGSL